MPRRANSARLWTEAEDHLFPALGLGPNSRALYYHLLRRTHLDGRARLRVTTRQLARGTAQSTTTVRDHLRKLLRGGCIRIEQRGRLGLKLAVFTPDEVLALAQRRASNGDARAAANLSRRAGTPNPFKNPRLRRRFFRRERGRCFYCLRQLDPAEWTLDHIVPRSAGGGVGGREHRTLRTIDGIMKAPMVASPPRLRLLPP